MKISGERITAIAVDLTRIQVILLGITLGELRDIKATLGEAPEIGNLLYHFSDQRRDPTTDAYVAVEFLKLLIRIKRMIGEGRE